MKYKKEFISRNQVVGPIDSMLRTVIGLVILVSSFVLSLSIFEMTELFGVTIYLWVTAITRWDPVYQVFYTLWDKYKTDAAIKGRF